MVSLSRFIPFLGVSNHASYYSPPLLERLHENVTKLLTLHLKIKRTVPSSVHTFLRKKPSGPLTSTHPDPLQYFYFVYNLLNTMSDISEHNESKFYYPDEVSDTELLEQTTFIENTE